MLILTSNGISSTKLEIKLRKYIKEECKEAVIITTASKRRSDIDKNIERHTRIFKNLGFKVTTFDIEIENINDLYNYDLIFIMGGNPFYLLNAMIKVNAKPLMEELAKSKIVIGASAGSIIMAQDIGYINYVEPELNDGINLINFEGLGITNIHIYPHKNNKNLYNENIQKKLKEYEEKKNIKITTIEDGEGIFIEF